MATPIMMKIVADNPPKTVKHQYYDRKEYKYRLYMRCTISNNILKVAFFLPEHMCTGGRMPTFELYISKIGNEFITFDRINNKWLTATLERLPWNFSMWGTDGTWISSKDTKSIQKYLGGKHSGYRGLSDFQMEIRADELKIKHAKETDPWDNDLAQIPALPKDWDRWVSKVAISENYIYYHYDKKGATTGYCTYCEKDVAIKGAKHNQEGRCSCCRRKITFKSIGRAGSVVTEDVQMRLIQRCQTGFVLRKFQGFRLHKKGECKAPICHWYEIRRIIYDLKFENARAYFKGCYKKCETRWIKTELRDPRLGCRYANRIYGKTLPSLARNELKYTGLCEMIPPTGVFDAEGYLSVLQKMPLLEKIVKSKLPRLTDECLKNYMNISDIQKSNSSSSLTKALGIDSQRLTLLRKNDGGCDLLKWLQYEKMAGENIPLEIMLWLCDEGITEDILQFILGEMNLPQVYNYIKRQMAENALSSEEVIITWVDYLSMANKLDIDISDEIVYKVRKLKQRHDELVARCQEKAIDIKAGEILEQYPRITHVLGLLKDKYEYVDIEYTVLAPACINEIICEGRALHHCAADSDRYWDRIERQEAYILFLRKTDDIKKSYYTLEIEPSGTVRQKRTMYDRQNSDIDDITKFLSHWQEIISQRITKEDKDLAEKSQVLRNKELLQLKKDNITIGYGDFKGQSLADVLIADLLVNVA